MSNHLVLKLLPEQAARTEPAWVIGRRHAGRAFAMSHGIPTPKHERWRYTQLAHTLAQTDDAPEPLEQEEEEASASADALSTTAALPVDGVTITLVDGALDTAQSDLDKLPSGLGLCTIAQAMDADMVQLESLMAIGDGFENNTLRAANDAMIADGVVIDVAANQVVSAPIHLVFLTTEASGSQARAGAASLPLSHPRLVVRLAPGAEATVIESHISATPETEYFQNIVTQVSVGDGAHFHHIKWQNTSRQTTHISTTDVQIARAGTYKSFVGHAGGNIARHDVRVAIEGAGAHADINGVYIGDSGQLHDITSLVKHTAAHATSNQMVRGVLQTGARGVFLGKTVVDPDAQKTDARQLHNALMLDNTTEVSAKPELEIYADDVQCAHGNTVGDIDPMLLFYMQARGIKKEDGRRMLIEGFLAETVEAGVPEQFTDMITAKVLEAIK